MQPLKTTSDVRTGSTGTGYNSLAGTLDVNATVEDVSPDPATLPQADRVSTVDAIPSLPLPGYGAITMHELWVIADRASDVIAAARTHLDAGDPGYDALLRVNSRLLAVLDYTCVLREVQP